MKKILIRPQITEKTMDLANRGIFTFVVDKASNKNQIRAEVENAFGVNVINIKTVTVKGKIKQVGAKRRKIVNQSWKKAVVTLKEGQKIDLFDVVGEEK